MDYLIALIFAWLGFGKLCLTSEVLKIPDGGISLDKAYIPKTFLNWSWTEDGEQHGKSNTDFFWIPTGYDGTIPPGRELPLVTIEFAVREIEEVNEAEQKVRMLLVMWVIWEDARLNRSGNMIVQDRSLLYYIWHPVIWLADMDYEDLVRIEPKEANTGRRREWEGAWVGPDEVYVLPKGSAGYFTQFSYTRSCKMKFDYFPGDVQRCVLELQSRGSQMVLMKPNNFDHTVEMQDHDATVVLTSVTQFETGHNYIRNGTRLYITLILRRKLGFHLLQTYLPSVILVVTSFFSLGIPSGSGSDPLALCTSVLLTLTALFASVREGAPTVSYIKALDVWMVACLVSVFLVLAQSYILLRLAKMAELEKRADELQGSQVVQAKEGAEGAANNTPSIKSMAVRMDDLPASRRRRDSMIGHKDNSASKEPVASCETLPAAGENTPAGAFEQKVRATLVLVNPVIFSLFVLCYWLVLMGNRNAECEFI